MFSEPQQKKEGAIHGRKLIQEQRLDALVKAFLADSEEYGNLPIPEKNEEKKRLLRSLMNIRLPGDMDRETLRIQDAYLSERVVEKEIVTIEEIPTIRDSGESRI